MSSLLTEENEKLRSPGEKPVTLPIVTAVKHFEDGHGDTKMDIEMVETDVAIEVDKENVVQKVDVNVNIKSKSELQGQQQQQQQPQPLASSSPVSVPVCSGSDTKEDSHDEMEGQGEEVILSRISSSLEVIEENEMDNDEDHDSSASMGGSFEEIESESCPNYRRGHGHRDLEIEDILDELEESVVSSEDTLLQDSDGVITFNMSLQKRLVELHDAFENFGQGGLSLSNFWTLYFETYVEPMGWRALWKPKGQSGRKNKSGGNSSNDSTNSTTLNADKSISKQFDTVEVTQVNCASLTARVKYEDDTTAFVALSELYPLAVQDTTFLSMKVTAKCIDNYRFFLNHLLFPWDSENADRWCELHLESRIQFYYDLQSGAISETMSCEIRDLIKEAKKNQDKIDKLEERLGFADTDEDAIEEDVVAEMLPVHMRQEEIKSRLQMLESPLWRNMLNKLRLKQNRTCGLITEKYILITTQSCQVKSLKSDLEFMESRMEDVGEKIKIMQNLQEAVDRCQPNATIFLQAGLHKISGLGFLEEGGAIIGIPREDEAVLLEPKDAGDVWLVANSETSVTLENLLIRITPKWVPPLSGNEEDQEDQDQSNNVSLINEAASSITFLTLRGSLKLNNVKIEGYVGEDGVGCDDTETIGIKALEQGIVSLENCNINNFLTGLVIREEAQLHMKSSRVSKCRMGIETNPGAVLNIDSSTIENCQKFGVIILSRSEDVATVVGNSELFSSPLLANCGFQISNIIIKDCLAGHICVCNEASVMEPEIAFSKKDKGKDGQSEDKNKTP